MRTVTGLYDSYDDARSAVTALEEAGVPSDHISIVTNKANGVDVEGQGSYAGEGAGAGAGVGAVAGGAVGGIVGAMISEGVPEDEANFYAEGIRRGGSVVTAKVEGSKAEVAQSILSASRPVDYGSRRTSYQQQGWSRFDESAEPYTIEQIEAERQRYRRG